MIRRPRGKGEGTTEVDVLVGQRLRKLRVQAGLSQNDLAATIGLTFQQLQKYERGVIRISASKLYLLSRQLGVAVVALFTDLMGGVKPDETLESAETVVVAGEADGPHLRSREALVLARHYMRIKDANARLALKAFVDACAGLGLSEKDAPWKRSDGTADPSNSGDGLRRSSRRARGVVWHPADIDPTLRPPSGLSAAGTREINRRICAI